MFVQVTIINTISIYLSIYNLGSLAPLLLLHALLSNVIDLLWSHDRVINFIVLYLAFLQPIISSKEFCMVTNQLLQEGSVC